MSKAVLLRAMKGRILKDGWIQEELGDYKDHGPVCLLGARSAVVDQDGDSYLGGEVWSRVDQPGELAALCQAIDELFEVDMSLTSDYDEEFIIEFNDDDDRQKSEVIEALRKGIEKYEQGVAVART